MKLFVVLCMLFMHIVDDYYLQGILAKMKQKKWWEDQPGFKNLYKYDYIIALIEHAFSWSFCVHIPLVIYLIYTNQINIYWIPLFMSILVNTEYHAIIDNEKANKGKINLIMDQSFHFIQIIITALLFFVLRW